MWVAKLLISPVKKGFFAQKTNLAFLFIDGSFGALFVGWLVVVACGLYLARHLFTLYIGDVKRDIVPTQTVSKPGHPL